MPQAAAGQFDDTDLTLKLAQNSMSFTHDALPYEAVEVARHCFLDWLGVTLAGASEPLTRILLEEAVTAGGNSQATIIGDGRKLSMQQAALINGSAGHALDYDDVTASMTGHPSIPLAPAVLGVGEIEGASGYDVVSAFVIGFEAECKVGRGLGRSHYARGFHQTTTLGALGSAAASARLMHLNHEQTAHALGIASSMAGGLRANFGSMTKPLQAGNAARGGVMAALLAREGFTGGDEILDGPIGFINAFSPAGDADMEAVDGFGDEWEVISPGISVKKYPCCFVTHRPADATLTLVEQHSLTPEMVDHVEVHVPNGAISSTGHVGPLIHSRPQTGLEGKFSLEYVVAASLFDGKLKFATFEDDSVQRPEVQAFLPKVTTVPDADGHPAADSLGGGVNIVEIHTTDGRVLSEALNEPRGGPSSPLSWDELLDKYNDCAIRTLSDEAAQRSAELMVDLDKIGNVRELTKTLSTA